MTMTTQDNAAETAIARRSTPIKEPIDRAHVGAIQLKDSKGGIAFNNMMELMDFAKLMAVSETAVPKHLRMNPGACLAVCMQAIEWRMSPFAVANKSYVVNDRISYEAAMFHAVASKRAPITGRIKSSFAGKNDTRICKVWATLADGTGEVEYESPEFGKIQPKNSPLWKNDPDQQLFYFSVRGFVRRHFSDVMMGIYTIDEIEDNPETTTPITSRQLAEQFNGSPAPSPSARLSPFLSDSQLSDEEQQQALRDAEAKARKTYYDSDSSPQPAPASDVLDASEAPIAPQEQTAPGGSEEVQFPHVPDHGRKDSKWIDDLILTAKPPGMVAKHARDKFHKVHAPHSWEKLPAEEQDRLFVLLVNGEFNWVN